MMHSDQIPTVIPTKEGKDKLRKTDANHKITIFMLSSLSIRNLSILNANSRIKLNSNWSGRVKESKREINYLPKTILQVRKESKEGNNEINANGWIRRLRVHKEYTFADLSDGSCFTPLQVIFDQSVDTKKLNFGSCISVTGSMKSNPNDQNSLELWASSLKILGDGDATKNPLQQRNVQNADYLRENAHLRPRTNYFGALLRIRSEAFLSVHRFFSEGHFRYVNTPIITANDCEGGGEAFSVGTRSKNLPKEKQEEAWFKSFFGREAYLTVSGQLHGESLASGLGRVYTFGPTFRAEKQSATNRHLSEFWMLEPEFSFGGIDQVMQLSEDLIKHLIRDLKGKCGEDLEFLNRWVDKSLMKRLDDTLEAKFEKVTYEEAINLLKNSSQTFEVKPEWGMDLSREHEKYICDTHFKKPTFVSHWPKEIKPFYMKQNSDGKTVACTDLLIPGVGELIGGSAREDNFEHLKSAIDKSGANSEGELEWYLDLRRFGTSPHAGFGMGFERFLMFMTGAPNIRDTIPIPVFPGFCKF